MDYFNYLADKDNIKTDNLQLIKNSDVDKKNLDNEFVETTYSDKIEIQVAKGIETISSKEILVNKDVEINLNHSSKIETTKVIETKARNGHNTIYCKKLEQTIERCPFTGISDISLLVHSHIKPWSVSTDDERLDGYNGLLLEYGYDMLFDRGWITFENDGTLLVSPKIPKELLSLYWLVKHKKKYNIYNKSGKRNKYLEYHRKYVYKS